MLLEHFVTIMEQNRLHDLEPAEAVKAAAVTKVGTSEPRRNVSVSLAENQIDVVCRRSRR